jgi:hypothetical protein
MKKQLCSAEGCFGYVDAEELVNMSSNSPHPLSLKCYNCRTDKDKKTLKNYRKRMRHKANKKL